MKPETVAIGNVTDDTVKRYVEEQWEMEK